MSYPNQKPFDPDFPTFDSVLLDEPPSRLEARTGDLDVDNHNTFGDVPDNYDAKGEPVELPVDGFNDAQKTVEVEVYISGRTGGIEIDTQDTHLSGNNLELLSSYRPGTLKNADFVPLAQVQSWVGTDDIIIPNNAFTRDQLEEWITTYNPQGLGGYFVFRDHGIQTSPLYAIPRAVARALAVHPERYNLKKGQRASLVIRGFVPQSYSCVQDSMGVPWGTRELMDVNGVEVRRVKGTALDFCPGLSAVHLAQDGKETWVNVESGGIIRAPIQGTPYTTEHLMMKALLAFPNVHFYNTALELKVHRKQIGKLPEHLQRWAYQKADSV